jgi:hypothetical protein
MRHEHPVDEGAPISTDWVCAVEASRPIYALSEFAKEPAAVRFVDPLGSMAIRMGFAAEVEVIPAPPNPEVRNRFEEANARRRGAELERREALARKIREMKH